MTIDVSYICQVTLIKSLDTLRMLSAQTLKAKASVLIHILQKGNKEKERTVKSSRNSVYGAPEHSWLLELAMEVHVKGKAAGCWTFSGICQMFKSFKHTYGLTETTPACYRCIHCLGNTLTDTHLCNAPAMSLLLACTFTGRSTAVARNVPTESSLREREEAKVGWRNRRSIQSV